MSNYIPREDYLKKLIDRRDPQRIPQADADQMLNPNLTTARLL